MTIAMTSGHPAVLTKAVNSGEVKVTGGIEVGLMRLVAEYFDLTPQFRLTSFGGYLAHNNTWTGRFGWVSSHKVILDPLPG